MSNVVSNAVSDAFADRCFDVAAGVVGIFVDKYKAHFAELMPEANAEKYVRGSVGLALITVAVSQLVKVGMTRETMIQQLDDALIDWPATLSTSESEKKI